MTHTSTEQERAEFEAAWIETGREQAPARSKLPDKTYAGDAAEFAFVWFVRGMQAARRAQVVLKCSECEDTGVGVSHGYDCTSCYGEFPAAPQPPECLKRENPTSNLEAAPVQMPTPDGYIMDSLPNGRLEYKRGPLSQMDSICNSTMPVYEYGTVRQLLADHGIQEQST